MSTTCEVLSAFVQHRLKLFLSSVWQWVDTYNEMVECGKSVLEFFAVICHGGRESGWMVEVC